MTTNIWRKISITLLMLVVLTLSLVHKSSLYNSNDVLAQDFTFIKARQDYIFSEDNYKKDLFDFNLKKGAYQKNKTLSLKEELRISMNKFVQSRNILVKNYLTMLRLKTVESLGIDSSIKESIYSKLDAEVAWYGGRKDSYTETTPLEDIVNKSKEEDSRYNTDTLPIIYFSLAHISLGEVKDIKQQHIKLYEELKNESGELIKLGRADSSLFERWFNDINKELIDISDIEKLGLVEIEKILGADKFQRESGYKKSIEILSQSRSNLLRLNSYVGELESVIANKR